MNTNSIIKGALLGTVGGMAMAMWSMIALAATGEGFFTPVNLIAHAVWDGAPLDGTFSGGALALGLVIHMMISMMLGIVIIAATASERLSSGARALVAMAIPLAAWAGQLIVWDAVDPAASAAFTPWVLFVGHAMFGMIAAAWVVLSERSHDPALASAHAHA